MILKVIRLKKKIDNRKFNIFALNSIYYSHLSIVVCYLGKTKSFEEKKEEIKINPYHIHTHQLFGPFISGFLDRINNFS